MATIKEDTFTVATDTTMDNHTSDSGGGWQGGADTGFTALAATDDLQRTLTSVATIIGDENPTETDYFVECELTTGGTSTNDRAGVVLRGDGGSGHASGSSSYYFFRVTGGVLGAVSWVFFRVESGIPSQDNLSGTLTGTLANVDSDDPVKLKATITGTGATVTIVLEQDENIDGGGFGGYSTLSTVTDTDGLRITSAGNVGVYMRNTNPRITYFNAEDLVGPAGDNTTIIVPTGPPLS